MSIWVKPSYKDLAPTELFFNTAIPIGVTLSDVEAVGARPGPGSGVAFRVFSSIGCRRKQTGCWYGVQ
jgi:hypothetical protein